MSRHACIYSTDHDYQGDEDGDDIDDDDDDHDDYDDDHDDKYDKDDENDTMIAPGPSPPLRESQR